MFRLLQGDVGSGKTIVALAAILKIRKRKLAAQTTSSNIITSSNKGTLI